MLRRSGWRVTLGSATRENAHSELFKDQGVEVALVRPNDPAFDPWIREADPDLVIFDRFMTEEQWGWRVAEHAPRALRVLDTIDLHALRRARHTLLKAGGSLEEVVALGPNLRTDDLARELGSIHRVDWTWVVSWHEKALLTESWGVPVGQVDCVPFLYGDDDLNPGPPFEARKDFVLIGNFRHPPNADGARWFLTDVWPLLRQRLPSAQVHLYGAYPAQSHMQWNAPKQGIHVHGPAPDVQVLSRYRVNLAPLRFGAGIKGKIADGWRWGTPCVTTPIGSEGMGNLFGGAVSTNPNSWVEHSVRLHEEASAWHQASMTGLQALRDWQSSARFEGPTLQALEDRLGQLEDLRGRNLTGWVLRHDTAARTRYFSRWIELKEKTKTSD